MVLDVLRLLWVLFGGLLVKAECRNLNDICQQVVTTAQCVEGEKQLPSLETGQQTLGVK